MSDPSAAAAVWPAAQHTGITPIQHPAWEEARNAILDLAAEGPVTVVLVGQAGTGKSWLLRELATALGEYGFPTMMLLQGDLPMTLSNGAALLVDEASRMDHATRTELFSQQHGIAVLADLERFGDDIEPGATTPVVIRMRPLRPDEIPGVVSDWLASKRLPAPMIGAAALSRLVHHSGGRIRSIVQLLGGATSMGKISGRTILDAADIDEAAELRLGGLATPPAIAAPPQPAEAAAIAPPPAPHSRARRRTATRALLTGTAITAIAASIALVWTLTPIHQPAKLATATRSLPALQQAETHDPAPAAETRLAATPPSLPPEETAAASDPAMITVPVPTQLTNAAPPLLSTQPPPDPEIALVSPPPPGALPAPEPIDPSSTSIAAMESQVPYPPAAETFRATSERHGGPGLILIAQRGDTLESLYGSVYRDRQAPPYAVVVAANPGPFKTGAIVVFPEPPGGWQRVER